jgi:hypothetical protein
MRDVLPTVQDIRTIYFKSQRKKNIIPKHANLTSKHNRRISGLLADIAAAQDPANEETLERELDLFLQAKSEYEQALFTDLRDGLETRILAAPSTVRLKYKMVGTRKVTVFNKNRPSLVLLDRYASLYLARSFSLRLMGRDQCLRVLMNTFQISGTLDGARQGILKVDIKDFYDSIDHSVLQAKIDGHSGVPRFIKEHIRSILTAQARLHGAARGIPQGVPSSAVLAEIYLESLDAAVKGNPDVALYLRYVDDIVVVTAGGKSVDEVESKIFERLRAMHLEANLSKAEKIVHPSPTVTTFQYLGYKFTFSELPSELISIDISDPKRARYVEAISKISKYRSSVVCWASAPEVDNYLLLLEYLLRPHATQDSGHGMRIVTGLAYSARFMAGELDDRPNFKMVLEEARREVLELRFLFTTKTFASAVATCACCGNPVHRRGEFQTIVNDIADPAAVMTSPAKPHADDLKRERVRQALWN